MYPMPIDATVMPSCAAEMKSSGFSRLLSTYLARRSPLRARCSMRVRRTATSANSAATKYALMPTRISTARSLRKKLAGSIKSGVDRARPPMTYYTSGRRFTSCRVCVLQRRRSRLRAVRDDGLAEAQSDLFELLPFVGVQLGIALCKEVYGFGHPLDLLSFLGADHAALANRAEELVASPIVRGLGLFRLGGTTILTTFTRQLSSF